jgi:hypothetical protein
VPLPFTPDPAIPVRASVSPTCIERGKTITLTVKTESRAVVAYLAIYSDNGTGAGKGYGKDYGGNDGGNADENGLYTSSWEVSLKAPPGPARVDVYVTSRVEPRQNHAGVPFVVADDSGNCS